MISPFYIFARCIIQDETVKQDIGIGLDEDIHHNSLNDRHTLNV